MHELLSLYAVNKALGDKRQSGGIKYLAMKQYIPLPAFYATYASLAGMQASLTNHLVTLPYLKRSFGGQDGLRSFRQPLYDCLESMPTRPGARPGHP